jgi:hypothetical protein
MRHLLVSNAPASVQAIGTTHAVKVRPLSYPIQYFVYGADLDLQGPTSNDAVVFAAPAGMPFTPGQIVGYIALAAGTAIFEVEDQHGVAG